MTTRHFCTYFDRNYLIKGLTLIRSLLHHNNDIVVYVVCMDELTRLILTKLSLTNVVAIPLHEIEEGDADLLNCRKDRSHVEYLWTSTPTIILRILERYREITTLTYLDADMLCFSDIRCIYDELGSYSVMIHEHRFPENLRHLERYGRFNVGLLVFRRDAAALNILKWWRERCIEWCRSVYEDNKFGDQKYLDEWPNLFPEVMVTANIGVGAAPWNHSQYTFNTENRRCTINEVPLVIYHFHAFHILNEALVVPVGNTDYRNPTSYYHHVILPYLRELGASVALARSAYPDFIFGLENKQFNLTSDFAFMVRTELLPAFAQAGLPENSVSLGPDWTLFPGLVTIAR